MYQIQEQSTEGEITIVTVLFDGDLEPEVWHIASTDEDQIDKELTLIYEEKQK